MDLARALEYLDRHPRRPLAAAPDPSATNGGATTLGRLLHVMGDPQRSAPVIVVAGGGDASTVVRLIGALLAESGLTAGTLVDAQLEHVGERLARNGESIGDLELAEALGAVADVEDLVGGGAGWDDVITAAAFGWFAQVAVDVAVVALGPSAPDVPALVDPALIVVTATDGAQAATLARRVPAGSRVVLGGGDDELRALFVAAEPSELDQVGLEVEVDENLAAVGGRLLDVRTRRSRYEQLFVGLHGAAYGEAAALALAGVEAFFDRPLEPDLVGEALAGVTAPGSFEVVGHGPLLVVDAAGDPRGAERVATTLAEDFDVSGHRILVIGVGCDAEPEAVLDQVGVGDFDDVIVTTDPAPGGVAARDLLAVAAQLGVEALDVPDVADALDTALARATSDDAVVVTGSAAVAGAARAHLRRRSPE